MSNSCDPMDCSLPAPLSMGFPRQEYWSGLPCPPAGDLPNPGIEPMSPTLQASSLPTEPMVGVPTSCVYIIDRYFTDSQQMPRFYLKAIKSESREGIWYMSARAPQVTLIIDL